MADKQDKKQVVVALDPNALSEMQKQEQESTAETPGEPSVLTMLLKSLQAHEKAQRMSFEVDPDTAGKGKSVV